MRIRALLAALLIGVIGPMGHDAPAAAVTATTQPTPIAHDLGIAATGTRLVWGSPSQVEQDLDRVAGSGATWLRFDVAWSQMSWSPGQVDWSRVDRVVNGAKARNLKVLGIVGTLAPWARPAGTPWNYGPRLDSERASFAAFASAAAARYAGRVDAWEVWNEPNLDQAWAPSPSATDYAALLRVTYPAIKRVCPGCAVVSGGTGGASSAADVDTWSWYRSLYSAGVQRYFDALGLHPYTDFTSGYGGEMRLAARVRNLMDDNGDAMKQMWATETGAPTAGAVSVGEGDVPDLMRESLDSWQSLPQHGPLFWYTIADTNDPGREGHFGLFRLDGSPKPAYEAMRTLASGAAMDAPRVSGSSSWSALPAIPVRLSALSTRVSVETAHKNFLRATSVWRTAKANVRRASATLRQVQFAARRHPTRSNQRRAASAKASLDRANRALRVASARLKVAASALAQARRSTSRPPVPRPPLGGGVPVAGATSMVVLRSTMTVGAHDTRADVTLRTNGLVRAKALIVAVRDANGANHDLWLQRDVVLNGTQVFRGTKAILPRGRYTYRVAYLGVDGTWTDLWPEQELAVGSTSTAPKVAPSNASMFASRARVKGSFTLFTSGRIPVKSVIVAVRDMQGRGGFDALASYETTLSGFQTFFPSRAPLPIGRYTYRVAYQTLSGQWFEVAPEQVLDVS